MTNHPNRSKSPKTGLPIPPEDEYDADQAFGDGYFSIRPTGLNNYRRTPGWTSPIDRHPEFCAAYDEGVKQALKDKEQREKEILLRKCDPTKSALIGSFDFETKAGTIVSVTIYKTAGGQFFKIVEQKTATR